LPRAPVFQPSLVRPVPDDEEVFDGRRAALEGGDIRGHLALASWGMDRGLRRRALDVYRKVLALDPSNVTAHRALGHVHLKGRWLESQAAKDAEMALLRTRFEKAGLVRYGSGWETPEGALRLRVGQEFVDGRWRKKDLARAARGMVKVDGKWVGPGRALAMATETRLRFLTHHTYSVHLGKHVVLASALGDRAQREMARSIDGAVEDLLALVGAAGSKSPWEVPVRAILLDKRNHLRAIQNWLTFEANAVPVWGRPGKDGIGLRLFRDNEGRPILAVFLGEEAAAPSAGCLFVYGIVRLAIATLTRTETPPYWISEGLAVMCEVTRAPGYCTSCAGNIPLVVEKSPHLADLKSVKAYLKKHGLIPLADLLNLTPAVASRQHGVQAVAFLTYLAGACPGAIAACLRPPFTKGDQAGRLKAVTRKTLMSLETEFRRWAKG